MPIRGLFEAMRPYQWVKNLLVFAPLLFARRMDDPVALGHALTAFAVFCATASAIYLLNDIVDRAADAQHPRKRQRPIPSGRLSLPAALASVAVLLAVAGSLGLLPEPPAGAPPFVVWPAAYFVLNVAYSLRLKQVAILDVLIVAFGFLLRVHAGSQAIGVQSSGWLLLCTFFFATLLAFAKRRAELTAVGDDGATRGSLRGYDVGFLDQCLTTAAASSILAYALYTLDDHTVAKHGSGLVLSVPFVCFGVFRYLWLVREHGGAEDPTRLLIGDRSLLATGALWLSAVLAAMLWAE